MFINARAAIPLVALNQVLLLARTRARILQVSLALLITLAAVVHYPVLTA